MSKELRIYRKLDNIAGGIIENCKEYIEEKPYTEGGITVYRMLKVAMKDGQKLNARWWYAEDISVFDISVDKAGFDSMHEESFESYLKKNGMYTEDVAVDGKNYQYLGEAETDGSYILQYVAEK